MNPLRAAILASLKADLQYAAQVIARLIQASKSPYMPPTPPKAVLNPTAPYDWSTPEAARHSLRVICDEEGLTLTQKNDFSRTINCESGYDNTIIMLNCTDGFVRSTHYNPAIHGAILSKDMGICQINTHYHIGLSKDFPSEDYVLQNPEACVRWAARVFKVTPNTWVCRSKGMYLHYTP